MGLMGMIDARATFLFCHHITECGQVVHVGTKNVLLKYLPCAHLTLKFP